MKKVIALVLVAIMLTFVCVSCGKPEEKPAEETTAEIVEDTSAEVVEETSDEVEETSATEEVTTEAATEKAA